MYKKYSLYNVDGNVFNILGYTMEAMRVGKIPVDERKQFLQEMTSGKYNYDDVVAQCMEYLDYVNDKLEYKYDEDDDE